MKNFKIAPLRKNKRSLSRIDEELKDIRREIVELKKSLSTKAGAARLQALEERVEKLERELLRQKQAVR